MKNTDIDKMLADCKAVWDAAPSTFPEGFVGDPDIGDEDARWESRYGYPPQWK